MAQTPTTQQNAGLSPAFSNPARSQAPKPRLALDMNKESDVLTNLEQTLADTYGLYIKTQYAHWNVTGPLFKPLHDLFEEQYQELFGALDVIAERIRQLGRFVNATFRDFSARSRIEEWQEPPKAEEMIRGLLQDNEHVLGLLRDLADGAETTNDQATVDLAAARLAAHEKAAWMLRVHLE